MQITSFFWVIIGANGLASDAEGFNFYELKEAIDSGEIHFLDPEPLTHDDKEIPYSLMGDDAFDLQT